MRMVNIKIYPSISTLERKGLFWLDQKQKQRDPRFSIAIFIAQKVTTRYIKNLWTKDFIIYPSHPSNMKGTNIFEYRSQEKIFPGAPLGNYYWMNSPREC